MARLSRSDKLGAIVVVSRGGFLTGYGSNGCIGYGNHRQIVLATVSSEQLQYVNMSGSMYCTGAFE